MKLSQIESKESKDSKSFSVEFFPPSTDAGFNNLISRAQRLQAMGAKFVSITWGAGGTSAERSVKLAQRLATALGSSVPIVLHLTCTNMSKKVLDETLKLISAPDSGIDNILALRGDKPRNDYNFDNEFVWAVDLVKYIKQQYGDRFCVGVAGYAEGFTDSPTQIPDVQKDIEYLADNVEAGAEFVMTQMFYDPGKFEAYAEKIRSHPRLGPKIADNFLFPGLMPLVSYRTFVRSAELSHASIPISVLQKIKKLDVHDDEQIKAYGVEMMTELIEDLMEHGVNKFHFFSLNLEKSLTQILTKTGLATHAPIPSPLMPGSPTLRAIDWDEFTNGRYTDPNSAAFGEIDGYGPVVHGTLGNEPNPRWGDLQTLNDISKMFIRHITNELPVFPFGDEPLSAETALIQEELINLNVRGQWTLSSQPAANGCSSSDKIIGWGPPNGKIYQHAYVECLVDRKDWADLKERVSKDENATYYAASVTGEIDSNCNKAVRNVVTWGVWGDSRADTTIIAYESFAVWRDETFAVLNSWKQLYKPDSKTYNLLAEVVKDRVLVTILYKSSEKENGLWQLLGV